MSDWKLRTLRRLTAGERFQVIDLSQREAKQSFREFVRYLMDLDIGTKAWVAHGVNGNLRVEFTGGGCVYFDSYKHPPRCGLTE